jgi:hypothetical protein
LYIGPGDQESDQHRTKEVGDEQHGVSDHACGRWFARAAAEMNLEVLVMSVSDFSAAGDVGVIQFTPPASRCSIAFGKNVTVTAPGSARWHGAAGPY